MTYVLIAVRAVVHAVLPAAVCERIEQRCWEYLVDQYATTIDNDDVEF